MPEADRRQLALCHRGPDGGPINEQGVEPFSRRDTPKHPVRKSCDIERRIPAFARYTDRDHRVILDEDGAIVFRGSAR